MAFRKGLKLGSLIFAGGSGFCLLLTQNEWCWKNINMPIIRLLPAENAHNLAVKLASLKLVPSFNTIDMDRDILKTSVWGLDFESPLGLAAGFDKHAECFNGMLKMGFSFVELGSVTPKPQYGNDKPRLFRLTEDDAVINRYGFNSVGHEEFENNLKKVKSDGIIGINFGKNKTSDDPVNDYVQGISKLGKYANYIVINVSSPNTPGLRKMQGKKALSDLLEMVLVARSKLPVCPPLLVKVAPDLTHKDREDIAEVVTNPKTRVDGLIVSNTTIGRPPSLTSANKHETGGLSGKPLTQLSTNTIKEMYKLTKGEIPIIGVGGISTGQDAYDKICKGASLVQLYSALSLEGPPVVGRVKRELASILRNNSIQSVKDAVGKDVDLQVD